MIGESYLVIFGLGVSGRWRRRLASCTRRLLNRLCVLLDGGLEGANIGTNNLIDLFAVLEEHECRHSPHAKLLSDIGNLVNIDLVEIDGVLVFFRIGELDHFGGDDLAGTAPGGEAVEDDQSICGALDDRGGVGGFAVDWVNTVFLCRFGVVAGLFFTQLGLVEGYVL